MAILIWIGFVVRDWINPKVTNGVDLVICSLLTFFPDMTGRSLLVEA